MNAPERLRISGKDYLREDLVGKQKTAKAIIPKELWAPVNKVLNGKKKEIKELKKLLRGGDSAALIEFARKTGVDYDILRKIMSLVNPALHSSETLEGTLGKAVKALKDAGIVKPIDITAKQLWAAWTKAIDNEAT